MTDIGVSALKACSDPGNAVGGAGLDAAKQARVEEILTRLSQVSDAFAQNVLAATADWSRLIPDAGPLEGMSERDKLRAMRGAQAEQLDGFLLTLAAPGYRAALDHIADRKLRHDLYEALCTRASDHGPRAGRFDNTVLVQETLALRHELALLLGYKNYAAFALRHSVLQDPYDVEHYLLQNGTQGRAQAQAELDAIWAFAKAKGAPRGFSSWDLGYYAEWLKREQLPLTEDELRGYFALPDVLSGLFSLCERLLGVRVVPGAPAHAASDSQQYRLMRADGDALGLLELEVTARERSLLDRLTDALGRPPVLLR